MTHSSASPSHSHEPPSQPDELIFQAPWEARAFALVNQLTADNHYSWSEWTTYLINEISATEKESPGSKPYYEHWVNACEKLLAVKGILTPETIQHKISELLAERDVEHKH